VTADVDLSRPRTTAHAIYSYNLHIVFVHRERWAEVREEVLGELAGMIERVSRAKSIALSRAGLLPDHIHLTLGCPIEVTPLEVVLAFLNNLAFVHGIKPVFQFGAYVGTFWRPRRKRPSRCRSAASSCRKTASNPSDSSWTTTKEVVCRFSIPDDEVLNASDRRHCIHLAQNRWSS
jgi:REP element-mobilizing transposase RayT